MTTCDAVVRDTGKLATLAAADLPEGIRTHLAGCARCRHRLAADRLACRLATETVQDVGPPDGFADRVRIALAGRPKTPRPEAEVWRAAWRLVPVFAAAVAALVLVYRTTEGPGTNGFPGMEGLSAGEYLVLGSGGTEMDAVLTAVLEGGGR
jgi:hypothetical protein